MDFAQLCTLFGSKIEEILEGSKHVQIDKSDVEKASKMFAKFAKCNLEQEELLPFVNNVYMFFLLVIKYAKQFDESSYHQECQLTVKMALGSFLSVVDKTQTYSRIIKRFVKIIDILIKEYRQFGIIQEILIVYICCLSNLEKNVLEKLARKHKFIHLLADTAINAHETSVQAAIIETVLKLSCTETPLLERMFPEVKMSLVADVVIDYLKIRPILEKLNENSTNIFSMNCTSVMLDHYLVSEFEGATSIDEVWLDVDLPLKRLSFFCTPGFLSSFTDVQFGQATNWEVLSFQVKDCLETTFVYKESIENLEIDIKIRTSSFNLFRNLKFHTIRHLVIQISKYSKKYEKFVKDILPQVFPNFLPEDFAYTFQEMQLELTDDGSKTNLFLQTSVDSKRSVTDRRKSGLDDKILDSISVVLTDEDEDDEIQEELQALEMSSNDTVKKTKCSRPQKIVDKSLSPISFTESVLTGKPKLKISRGNMKRNISSRTKSKISAPKKRKPIQTSEDSKSLVTDKRNSDLDDKHVDSTSVVDLTEDDEDDEMQEQLQALELSSDDAVKKTKCSRPQKIVDKSLSPISFSESVLAGKPKSKVSKMVTRTKSKISAAKKRKPKPLKISVMTVSLTDHPPKQISPQITSKAKCKKITYKAKSKEQQNAEEEQEQNAEEASNENNFDRCPLEEDLVVRDAAIDNLELAQSKVKDWLNTYMSDQKESPVLLQGSPEFKIPEPRTVQYEDTPDSIVSSSNQPLDQQITKWLSEGHYEPSETTREFITQKMSGRTESLLETLARDDDKSTDIPPPVDMALMTLARDDDKSIDIPLPVDMALVTLARFDGKSTDIPPPVDMALVTLARDDDESTDIPPPADMALVTQSKETEEKESHLPIEIDIINHNNGDEYNDNQPNNSDNSESSNIPLAQLAAAHLEKKNQKPLNTSHTSPIIADVKIIEYGSISDDEISSAEERNRDLEDEHQERNLSKQLFEYIIDKEVVKTNNLSKPAVDEDAENQSPPTGNSVNTQKTQRKQRFQEIVKTNNLSKPAVDEDAENQSPPTGNSVNTQKIQRKQRFQEVVKTNNLSKPAVDEDAENHSPPTGNSVNTQKTQRKQRFQEVVKTNNLSKPAVDEDAENHSPLTENSVKTQKIQRKQRFQSRADYLFDQLKAHETKISMNNETSTKNLTIDQIKAINESPISENDDTLAVDNFSTKQSVADSSIAESKTRKRRLFNPNDLSYLENMITDDYINSKSEEEVPVIEINEKPSSSTDKAPAAKRGRKKKVQNLDDDINSKSVEKIPIIEIKERRSSSTKMPPAAKKGRKKKVQELDIDFSKLKTTVIERKPAVGTEGSLQKVFAEWRSRNQAHKEQIKKQKLMNKSRKRRGKKNVVVSSPSTESSLEPFGIPMETLLKKRRSVTAGESPTKRIKANDGTSKNIKVISNIVIKEADTLQPEPDDEFNNLENRSGHQCSYCELAVNDVHRVFLNYLDHAKTCKSKTFKREKFRKILNIIEKDFLHN